MMSQQSKNRKAGNIGQMLTARELELRGVQMVETIETGWGIVRGKGGRIVDAYPLEKVAGDFRGVLEGGRSVLVEAKTTPDRLPYSQLKPHQHDALQTHHELGGLSLVAWVHSIEDAGVIIFEYPNAAFVPRKSVKVGTVEEWYG